LLLGVTSFPKGECTFAETDEIKNALAVVSGGEKLGFVTGGVCPLIKTLLKRGVFVYCKCVEEKIPGDKTPGHFVLIYYRINKI